jgi:hypothetical protein
MSDCRLEPLEPAIAGRAFWQSERAPRLAGDVQVRLAS